MDILTQQAPTPAQDLLRSAHVALQNASRQRSPSSAPPEATPVKPLNIRLLEDLWRTMAQTYGHRWTSSFGEFPRADHAWAKHLTGLSGRQIANGLTLLGDLHTAGWPPSAPQFRRLCLQVPGLPDEAAAWAEALQGAYSHEAVRVAAEATSTFDLKSARPGDKALRQRFERNYAIVMRRAQTGQPLAGRIAKGLCHDSARPREQLQLEHSDREVMDRVRALGIPTDGAAAHEQLLASLHIRRGEHG